MAIIIEIDDGNMHCAVPAIEIMQIEFGHLLISCYIFAVDDSTDVAPTKLGNDQIDIAVAIKVGGAHIGDSAEPADEFYRLIAAPTVPLQPVNRPFLGI